MTCSWEGRSFHIVISLPSKGQRRLVLSPAEYCDDDNGVGDGGDNIGDGDDNDGDDGDDDIGDGDDSDDDDSDGDDDVNPVIP